MACCSAGNAEQAAVSRQIDKELKAAEKEFRKQVKLLLLGAGESGKSTIAKQLKIIHMNGFTPDEKNAAKPVIYANIVASVKALVDIHQSRAAAYADESTRESAQFVRAAEYFAGPLTAEFASNASRVWADPTIKLISDTPSPDYHIPDSTAYFLDNLQRIISPDYVPTPQDILRARSRTTGELEYEKASQFINQRFQGMNENPKKLLYTHFTCATDTDNITVVFKAVKDIVLRQGLQSMGIME